jgi:hypothetical protein
MVRANGEYRSCRPMKWSSGASVHIREVRCDDFHSAPNIVDRPADHGLAKLALQPGVGLLSEQWPRSGSSDSGDPSAHGLLLEPSAVFSWFLLKGIRATERS